jgi:hypothetical protein
MVEVISFLKRLKADFIAGVSKSIIFYYLKMEMIK